MTFTRTSRCLSCLSNWGNSLSFDHLVGTLEHDGGISRSSAFGFLRLPAESSGVLRSWEPSVSFLVVGMALSLDCRKSEIVYLPNKRSTVVITSSSSGLQMVPGLRIHASGAVRRVRSGN